MTKELSRDDFAGQVGTTFRVFAEPEGEALEVELIEATEVREQKPYVSYSLVFLARPDADVDQQLFRVEHEELGEFELFLVPFGVHKKGVQLEAAFSQIVE